MNFDAIKHEISTWDDEQLGKLATLVMAIRQLRDPEFRAMLKKKMDQPPEAWVTAEEAARRLGIGPEAAA